MKLSQRFLISNPSRESVVEVWNSDLAMSDVNDPVLNTTVELEGLVVSLVITIITLLVCIICMIVICIVRCSLQDNGQGFLPRTFTMQQSQRDPENQEELQQETGDESGVRDLSEAPPPAYRNVSEYQNVDVEHAEVIRMKSMYRLSGHMEAEITSLPPDYISTRGEDEVPQRYDIAAVTRELTEVPEGELPPTYSTAQLALMGRRTADPNPNPPRELSTLTEDNTETHTREVHLPSDTTQTEDSVT